jgi:hypothetical protein
MVKEEFEQEEVEEMRQMLRHEGWQAGEHLPDNWFVRGEHLMSTKAAIELLQQSGADPEGLARLRRLPRGDRWAREESDHDNSNSKIKTERTKQDKSEVTTRSIKIIRTEHKWESDDNTLPAGWLVRRGEGFQETFLTAKKVQVAGRLQTLEHLARAGHPAEKVARFRAGLKWLGWEPDLALPTGYLRWEAAHSVSQVDRPSGQPDPGPQVAFLTPANEMVEGTWNMLDHLLDSARVCQSLGSTNR